MCNCVEELHENVEKSQLTADLGGEIPYCHQEWLQQRVVSKVKILFGNYFLYQSNCNWVFSKVVQWLIVLTSQPCTFPLNRQDGFPLRCSLFVEAFIYACDEYKICLKQDVTEISFVQSRAFACAP